jgi:RNA polymerase sigma-70 factor (ECF subfamily)
LSRLVNFGNAAQIVPFTWFAKIAHAAERMQPPGRQRRQTDLGACQNSSRRGEPFRKVLRKERCVKNMVKLRVKSSEVVDRSLVGESAIEPSDEQLLERYRSFGDRAAFAKLVHRYERELFGYLRRYLADAAAAEDAFQTTFLQVHLKCRYFDGARKFRPWLYTIATHQAIDSQRRDKRFKTISLDRPRSNADADDLRSLIDLLASREADPTCNFEANERKEWVQKAVAALPEVLRGALVLVYYQGLKYREAAEVLGVPVGTAKTRVHAAILKLIEEWRAAHSESTKVG